MWVIYPILLLKTLASGSTLPLLKHVESDYVSKSSSCCELDPYCFFGNFNWYYSKKMIPHIFPISLSLPHGPDSSPASFAASMHDRTSLECGALGPGVRKATKIKYYPNYHDIPGLLTWSWCAIICTRENPYQDIPGLTNGSSHQT